MLNPSFNSEINRNCNFYSLPENIQTEVMQANMNYDTNGIEKRLDKLYTDQINLQLKTLSIDDKSFWQGKRILDLCAGTGYLSYHLSQLFQIDDLTILDISEKELDYAKILLKNQNIRQLNSISCDIFNNSIKAESFDIIIGNSYLHHFYDIPKTLEAIHRLVKPSGFFISIHEPSITTEIWENASMKKLLLHLKYGEDYINIIRDNPNFKKDSSKVDVWLFSLKDINTLLLNAGFKNNKIKSVGLFKQFCMQFFNLHLTETKLKNNIFEKSIIKLTGMLDIFISKIVKGYTFSSISFITQKNVFNNTNS